MNMTQKPSSKQPCHSAEARNVANIGVSYICPRGMFLSIRGIIT